jgi:hypothetical protein
MRKILVLIIVMGISLSGNAFAGGVIGLEKVDTPPEPTANMGKLYIKESAPSFDSYTKLLLNFDSDFADSIDPQHIVSPAGITIRPEGKFGSGTAYFNGKNSYISIADHNDWYFGTGDFTIDLWVNFNNVMASSCIASQYVDSSNRWAMIYEDQGNGTFKLHFYFVYLGSIKGNYATTSPIYFSPNTWYHIAIERKGTGGRLFINGVSQELYEATAFGSNDIGDLAAALTIGANNRNIIFNGVIDELRVSKGIARWTSDFTPPGTAYVPEEKTLNLYFMDEQGFEYKVKMEQ